MPKETVSPVFRLNWVSLTLIIVIALAESVAIALCVLAVFSGIQDDHGGAQLGTAASLLNVASLLAIPVAIGCGAIAGASRNTWKQRRARALVARSADEAAFESPSIVVAIPLAELTYDRVRSIASARGESVAAYLGTAVDMRLAWDVQVDCG